MGIIVKTPATVDAISSKVEDLRNELQPQIDELNTEVEELNTEVEDLSEVVQAKVEVVKVEDEEYPAVEGISDITPSILPIRNTAEGNSTEILGLKSRDAEFENRITLLEQGSIGSNTQIFNIQSAPIGTSMYFMGKDYAELEKLMTQGWYAGYVVTEVFTLGARREFNKVDFDEAYEFFGDIHGNTGNVDTFFLPNVANRVLRHVGGDIAYNEAQEDAGQKITGRAVGNNSVNPVFGGGSGAFVQGGSNPNTIVQTYNYSTNESYNYVDFDSSRVTRTAQETRVKSLGGILLFKLKNVLDIDIVNSLNGSILYSDETQTTTIKQRFFVLETFNAISFGIRMQRTGLNQNIANNTRFNLLSLLSIGDIQNLQSFQPNWSFGTAGFRFPSIAVFGGVTYNIDYQDYVVVFRLSGTIGGASGTAREINCEIERVLDNSLVARTGIIKINGNDLTNRQAQIETFTTGGATDPFIQAGVRLFVNNDTGQNINLTGFTILIKGR